VIARKNRIRRSSAQMMHDPFTFVVALNSDETAYGELYIDDGDSFDFKLGTYVYRAINYVKVSSNIGILKSSVLGDGKMYVRNKVEKIIVVGINKPTSVISRATRLAEGPGKELYFEYEEKKRVLVVKQPDVVVSTNWEVEFKF